MICCRFVGRSISHGCGERQAIVNAGAASGVGDTDAPSGSTASAGDVAMATRLDALRSRAGYGADAAPARLGGILASVTFRPGARTARDGSGAEPSTRW